VDFWLSSATKSSGHEVGPRSSCAGREIIEVADQFWSLVGFSPTSLPFFDAVAIVARATSFVLECRKNSSDRYGNTRRCCCRRSWSDRGAVYSTSSQPSTTETLARHELFIVVEEAETINLMYELA
jgi:hypothetical protein